MNVLYVHGLNGGNGSSAGIVDKCLKNCGYDVNITAPVFDLNDFVSVKNFFETNNDFDLIVASSFGCSYVLSFCDGPQKILINPAFPEDVKNVVNHDVVSSLSSVLYKKLGCKDWENNIETYFIFGNDDDVVNNYKKIVDEFHYPDDHCAFVDNMPHKLNDEVEPFISYFVRIGIENKEKYKGFDPICYVLEELMSEV